MTLLQVFAAAVILLSLSASGQGQAVFDPSTISKAANDAIAWTRSVIDDVDKWVPPGSKNFVFKRSSNPRGWVQGAFLVGMKDWATASQDETHWNYLKTFAETQGFQLGDRVYHADDHVVGQYYIALAEHFNLPAALGPVTARFDNIIANPVDVDLNHTVRPSPENQDLDYNRACQFRWCWCDALFMSPPTFFALSEASGDPKYSEFSDKEYFATTEYLFREFDDIPGGLYLRDSTFFDPLEDPLDSNGNLIFWSRGNGWVFAGLPAILRTLSDESDRRFRYIEIFTQMAQAIKATQIPEGDPWAGFWGPSLRAFDLFSTPESSGTGFFVGGLAWGIAEGILSPGEYLDVVKGGWSALLSVQVEDGSVGWTQQIGSEPDSVAADNVQLYGVGAFLQAAAGMLRLHELGMLGTTDPVPDLSVPMNPIKIEAPDDSLIVEEDDPPMETPQPRSVPPTDTSHASRGSRDRRDRTRSPRRGRD